jgi:hypothetical protein
MKTIIMKHLFYLFCCSLALQACHSPQPELIEYYYPLDSLMGKTAFYTYSTNDFSYPLERWSFTVKEQDNGKLYLEKQSWADSSHIDQTYKIELTQQGAIIREQIIIAKDSLGQWHKQELKISNNVDFPFAKWNEKESIWRFKASYIDPLDSTMQCTYTRDRQPLKQEEFAFNGKTYKAIRFSITEFNELNGTNGGHWEITHTGEELYAQGLGLVYQKKGPKGQTPRELKLLKITKN